MRIKHNGLGFTGYTWDSVLGVWFAQARMYDASSKRFLSADPIGGSIHSSQSVNPYTYCNNDPVNLIDPTGMWDEKGEYTNIPDGQRSAVDQAGIRAATQAYYAATDQAGRDAAHAVAMQIRNNPTADVPIPFGYPYAYPPNAWDVLASAVSAVSRNPVHRLAIGDVMKTATEWGARIGLYRPSVTAPIDTVETKFPSGTVVFDGMLLGLIDMSQISRYTLTELFEFISKNSDLVPGGPYNNGSYKFFRPDNLKKEVIRLDPADNTTNYDHAHFYDENGNLLDSDGNVVGDKDPSGHQRLKNSNTNSSNDNNDDDDRPGTGKTGGTLPNWLTAPAPPNTGDSMPWWLANILEKLGAW